MHLVALQFVLVITRLLGGGGQALTVTQSQNATNPPEETLDVTEGDNLTLICNASDYSLQQDVHWGKKHRSTSDRVWLTQNSVVESNDSRLSLETFRRDDHSTNYFTYSMQISHVTSEDMGMYICFVTWTDSCNREGYVHVRVRSFPKEEPICSTNQTANSTSESVYLWCDTVKGSPGVDVTWTVEGTVNNEISTSSVDSLDAKGRERVRMELRLISTDWGNHWTKEFVCTVTSFGFPGLNRTCSVNVTAEQVVTTEAYFNGNVHSTLLVPEGSDATQIPDSSVSYNTLAIALVIPALFTALFTVLICVLKRKRQRKNRRGRKTQRATSPIGPNKARGGEGVVSHPITLFENESYQPPGDVKNRVTPYEVELDFNGESAFYPHIPDESTKRDLKRSSTDHKAVQSERPEERQEDNIGYETLNWDRKGSSSPVPETKTDMSGKDGGQAPQNVKPVDELEGVDDYSIDGESDEGSVDNPIYEPSGNGQDGSRVKPEPQADESHIYQMIN